MLVPGPVHQNGADSGLRGPKCRKCQSKWSVSRKNLSLSWTELGLSWTELGLSWTELGLSWTELGFSRKWLGFGFSGSARTVNQNSATRGGSSEEQNGRPVNQNSADSGRVALRSNEGPVNQTRKILVKIGVMRRKRYQSKALDELIPTKGLLL